MSDDETIKSTSDEQGIAPTASPAPDATAPVPEKTVAEVTPEEFAPKAKPLKFTLTVDLPSGKPFTVHKLKSGKYYEAQKYYIAWISEVQKFLKSHEMDPSKVIGPDGKPDLVKIEEYLKDKSNSIVDALVMMSEGISQKRLDLLEICTSLTRTQLTDDFYPEDLLLMTDACMEVNDFDGNVKKSAAPTSGLGA